MVPRGIPLPSKTKAKHLGQAGTYIPDTEEATVKKPHDTDRIEEYYNHYQAHANLYTVKSFCLLFESSNIIIFIII